MKSTFPAARPPRRCVSAAGPKNISTAVDFPIPCGLISTWHDPQRTSTGSFTSTDSRWSISSFACHAPKSGSASR
eukprot:31194-Pelagococcus_subviridis.AAC.22